jgi:hypothetical protein
MLLFPVLFLQEVQVEGSHVYAFVPFLLFPLAVTPSA